MYNISSMIKKLVITIFATATLLSMGCRATATVGKTANPPWVAASAGKDGVTVVLPFVKAEVVPVPEGIPGN